MSSNINQEIISSVLKASQKAAINAFKFIGTGLKNEADAAAVKGMRDVLNKTNFRGKVVIGEGEKDEAPMLYIGEELGTGKVVEYDIAVDPLEGTSLCANDLPNSLTTIAIAPKGSLLAAPEFYMEKLAAAEVYESGVISLSKTIEENIKALARYKEKDISQIVVTMLDRPRHKDSIARIRKTGAKVALISDGDIYGVLSTHEMFGEGDLYYGQGGAPEGVLSAVALKAMGGFMEGRIIKEGEKTPILSINDMVKQSGVFIATGVTGKGFLERVQELHDGKFFTESVIISANGVQFVENYEV
jgi:fructose-1,6-bisphosphatase II / sedoheptulose-1,7-bisphosphatase